MGRYFQWVLGSLLLHPGWWLLLLVISTACAAIVQRPFKRRLWKPYHWMVLLHLAFLVAVIGVGTICAYGDLRIPHSPSAFGTVSLQALFYGSLVSCAFWIWRMKGFRWFASSLMGVMEIPTIWAVFVAGMSVTGVWL